MPDLDARETESFTARPSGAPSTWDPRLPPEGRSTGAFADVGAPAVPARFGRYQVQAPLGAGGMGVVYLAYDRELDRHVAIKVVKQGRGGGRLGRQRQLLVEAKAMAKVAHPNVVTIHDVGVLGDAVFVAMERIAGPTLRQWLREKRRPWTEVLDVLIGAGRGLSAIHAAGIVHRDVKPANVLIGADGAPKIADFGLAKIVEGEGEGRGGERRLSAGTPGYRSPEQARGGSAGVTSDVYSLCVMLFEALHGELPYAGKSDLERAELCENGVRAERPRGSSVPPVIDAVIDRGLRGAPEERWPSVEALLGALSRARRPRRAGWIGLGVAATALASLLLVRPGASACPSHDELLGELWDGARRTSIEAMLRSEEAGIGADGATIVGEALERYAAGYAEARREVCRAAEMEELSGWQAAQVERCIDERRDAFAALLGLLRARGTALAPRAAGLVERLDPVTSCRPSPERRPEASGLREDLAEGLEARLSALSVALLARERELAAGLLEELERRETPRSAQLRIRLMRLRASYACLMDRREACVAGYREALGESLVQGLDLEAARASIALVRETDGAGRTAITAYDELAASLIERAGLRDEELDLIRRYTAIGALRSIDGEGAVWPAVEALLRDVRAAPSLSNHLRLAVYSLALRSATLAGGVATRVELADEALEFARVERGQSHPVFRELLHEVIQARTSSGDLTGALELADLAVATGRPGGDRSESLSIRAVLHERAGRVHEELDDFRAAVEECAAVGDCNPSMRAGLANSLGVVLDREGEYDEARALLRGVLARPTEGIWPGTLLFVRLSLADVELHSGRLDSARELFREVAPDIVAELGEESMYTLYARRGLALVDLAAGNPDAARARLEADVARWEDKEPWELATTLFALAQAVDESAGGDRERSLSRDYAERAASLYRRLAPGFDDELAVVDAWLRAR